jgi:hypothetical protein
MLELTTRGLLTWPAPGAPIRHRVRVSEGGCAWITDASIRHCLDTGHFEEIDEPYVHGASHDAARIATMVSILRQGGILDPVVAILGPRNPTADPRIFKLWFHDGSHRFRAYQFAGIRAAIPARFADLSGAASLFEPFFQPFS